MKKKILSLITVFLALLMLAPVAVSAKTPYQTHTYMATDRVALFSPDAYVPITNVTAVNMGIASLNTVADMFIDSRQNVYLVDSGTSTVYVLNRYYKKQFEIKTFVNNYGISDSFSEPKGIFVNDKNIYVCDTNANRIVVFDLKGKFERIIEKPSSPLFGEDAIYKPIAMVVDRYGRIYVVSSTTFQGIILMTQDGQFTGFIGAQKVTYNILDLIWQRFQTEEQRKSNIQNIPTEFNNISINSDGFIYATISSLTSVQQFGAISAKNGKYSPVKMLNSSGAEVMSRNGFYDPAGEIVRSASQVSKIVDVAMGPEGTWTIIDNSRSKCYTYDNNGNLLFAFGDEGSQLGNIKTIKAVAYQGDKLVLLDSSSKSFTVYKRTEYGDTLIEAIANTNRRQFDKAVDYWKEILKRNSNFDSAYIGIGQSLFRDAKYKESMGYYESAYDVTNWSSSYKEVRKEWITKFILIIPVTLIAVVLIWTRFLKYAKKVNTAASLKVGRKSFWEELLYVFHLQVNPFDGFWDLKHEKRGSMRASITILAVVVASFYYKSIGTGYILNRFGNYQTIVFTTISIAIPVLLWAVANWCLTTLFEGEGSLKDIFIAMCYAISPTIPFTIISTLLSNVVTNDEKQIVSFIYTIGFIWAGILIFFGMMVTHDYSMGKNLLISACTVVGMAFIVFIAVLFSSLLKQMLAFVSNLIIEINYRL